MIRLFNYFIAGVVCSISSLSLSWAEPLSLQRVIEIARNDSPGAHMIGSDIAVAESDVQLQKYRWYPTLQAVGNISQIWDGSNSQIQRESGDLLTDSGGLARSGSLRFNVNLYRGGTDLSSLRSLQARLEYFRRLSVAEKRDRELAAIEFYFNLGQIKKVLTKADENIRYFGRYEDQIARTFQNEGVSLGNHDVFMRTNFSNRELFAIRRSDEMASLVALRTLLGRHELKIEDLKFEEYSITKFQTVQELVGDAPTLFEEHDVLDLAMQSRAEENSYRARTQIGEFMPVVNAFSIYNTNGEVAVGARVTIPVFDAALRYSETNRRFYEENRRFEAQTRNRKLELGSRRELFMREIENSIKILDLSKKPYERAKKMWELEDKRFHRGMIEVVEYTNANHTFQGLYNLRVSQISRYLAAIYSLKALGMKVNFQPN